MKPIRTPSFPLSNALSVSELNGLARDALEAAFPLLWVRGEISNFVRATSGHWYFSLKDAKAQIRCTLFRTRNALLDWVPKNGDCVEVRAFVTLYEARGEFQIAVEEIRRAGFGALYEAFEALKLRLQAQGLFNAERKRNIPRIPRHIGIVTSLSAAALRDVLTTLKRRMPSAAIVIYPTPVQGADAAARIVKAIQRACEHACCDVLIVCRGGGSIEDLWPFNEEIVAQAVFRCTIPVVSGVGHETDFTIADFVADMRAPTPTGAAELATVHRQELVAQLKEFNRRLHDAIARALRERTQLIDGLARGLIDPKARIAAQRRRMATYSRQLMLSVNAVIERARWRLKERDRRLRWFVPRTADARRRLETADRRLGSALSAKLLASRSTLERLGATLRTLDPENVLKRGYSLVYTADGDIVRDTDQLVLAQHLDVQLARGNAQVTVTRLIPVGDPPEAA